MRVVNHHEADVDSYFDKGVAYTREGEPEAKPEGVYRKGEEKGEDANHEQSWDDDVVVAYFISMKIFHDEDSDNHGKGPTAEEKGKWSLNIASLGCKIGDEGAQPCQVAAIGYQGECIENKMTQVLVSSEMLQHLNEGFSYFNKYSKGLTTPNLLKKLLSEWY